MCFDNNNAFLDARLAISRTSTEGRKDPKLAHAHNQAANAHLDRYMIDRAVELYRKGIAILESSDGFTETVLAIPVANLATALWLDGRYDEAYDLLIKNLKARESVFGVNDTESFRYVRSKCMYMRHLLICIHRTGKLLHVLDNVCASQGHMSDSLQFHQRALNQYRSTIGENHHRTGDLYYKVSEHYHRMGKYTTARFEHLPTTSSTLIGNIRKHLDHAIRIYSTRSHFTPELARAHHFLSVILDAAGVDSEASKARNEAVLLYRKSQPYGQRADQEISAQDYDRAICPRSL